MGTGFRDFDLEKDVEALAALLGEAAGEPVSLADARRRFGNAVEGTIFHGVMTADRTGYADAYRQPWHTDRQFTTRVVVAGQSRGRGVGAGLLAEVTDRALAGDALTMRGNVREANADGVRFAEHHGFSIVRRVAESRLDPRTVDRDVLVRPAAAGIIVASLQEMGDDEANRHAFWDLYERLAADIPSDQVRRRRPYAEFTRQFFEASWFRAAGQFVAVAGDEWVGIGALSYHRSTNSLYHQFTGVDSAHRGRHIAAALKHAMIAYALEIGADYLRASNDSENAPIIAINRAYGYLPQPGSFEMVRQLRRLE